MNVCIGVLPQVGRTPGVLPQVGCMRIVPTLPANVFQCIFQLLHFSM